MVDTEVDIEFEVGVGIGLENSGNCEVQTVGG
jgi:hypothetical protein